MKKTFRTFNKMDEFDLKSYDNSTGPGDYSTNVSLISKPILESKYKNSPAFGMGKPSSTIIPSYKYSRN